MALSLDGVLNARHVTADLPQILIKIRAGATHSTRNEEISRSLITSASHENHPVSFVREYMYVYTCVMRV